MDRFQASDPTGVAVQQLEVLVRTAIFKPANALIAFLLQTAADRIDASYQPKAGEQYQGRVSSTVEGIFGSFTLERAYYYVGAQQSEPTCAHLNGTFHWEEVFISKEVFRRLNGTQVPRVQGGQRGFRFHAHLK